MRVLHLLVLSLSIITGSAWAEPYPDKSRPIKIVIPFGAAILSDLMGRALARGMSDIAGVNVIVENKPGADGVIGMQAVKTAAPDGYTILLTSSSTQVLNVHMLANLSYDPVADYVPLTGMARVTHLLHEGPSLSHKTAREFIEAARRIPASTATAAPRRPDGSPERCCSARTASSC
jgi:tripartite-type tricarboxylate transporter receptor subunit TctC